ncbi:hypothetical protein GWK47_004648 [Chionoecetes opilio]|uniref:Uncharacterized protein n=1 Tax=Chionoecetes opilio TaxID=41210 RepID=A0A8J4YCJ8_CHIOP|nr:hypothetical protein GWK47_004648 [Chionoecetes opilio]
MCQIHFIDTQFMNGQSKEKLIWNAIPTIFLSVPNPPQPLQASRKPPVHRAPPVDLRDSEPSETDLIKPECPANTGEMSMNSRDISAISAAVWRPSHETTPLNPPNPSFSTHENTTNPISESVAVTDLEYDAQSDTERNDAGRVYYEENEPQIVMGSYMFEPEYEPNSETRSFETETKTKTTSNETKAKTKTTSNGLETGLETKTSLKTYNTGATYFKQSSDSDHQLLIVVGRIRHLEYSRFRLLGLAGPLEPVSQRTVQTVCEIEAKAVLDGPSLQEEYDPLFIIPEVFIKVEDRSDFEPTVIPAVTLMVEESLKSEPDMGTTIKSEID